MASGEAGDESPPAIPHRDPSAIARRIASGHAGIEHFPDLDIEELAGMIQYVMDFGQTKRFRDRVLYWDSDSRIAVLANPRDDDGGTAFLTDETYFRDWGAPSRGDG